MLGFSGVFLVIRPGFIQFQIETLYVLCAVAAFSIFIITTRVLSQTESSLAIMFFSTFVGLCVLPLAKNGNWFIPASNEFLFLTWVDSSWQSDFFLPSLEACNASLISPLTYFSISGITTVEYFWFGDVPILISLTGLILIFGAMICVLCQDGKKQ